MHLRIGFPRTLPSVLTSRHALQVGGEFAVSVAEQQRQLDALKILDAGLSSAALINPTAFEVRSGGVNACRHL